MWWEWCALACDVGMATVWSGRVHVRAGKKGAGRGVDVGVVGGRCGKGEWDVERQERGV